MSIATQLKLIAAQLADQAQKRGLSLEPEKLRVEARLREIEAERNQAKLSLNRLANFQIQIGADYQCPSCWIERETRSTLRPAPVDLMKCNTCHAEFSIT